MLCPADERPCKTRGGCRFPCKPPAARLIIGMKATADELAAMPEDARRALMDGIARVIGK